jgi:hypothetical protein
MSFERRPLTTEYGLYPLQDQSPPTLNALQITLNAPPELAAFSFSAKGTHGRDSNRRRQRIISGC